MPPERIATAYGRDEEPIDYHGPHELWNIAGEP